MLEGRVVALIDVDHFSASYIGRVLVRAGASLLGPAESLREAVSLFHEAQPAPEVACVGADFCEHSPAIFGELAVRSVPCLFIGGSPYCESFPGPHSWLNRPFAGYQIVDALAALLGRQAPRHPFASV